MKYFVLPLLVSCSVLFGQQNSKSLEDRADSFWNDFADLSGARDSSTSLVFPDSLSVDKLIIPLDSAERLYLAAYHTESSEDCLAYAIECVENMYNLFRSEAREREFLRYTDRLSRNYHPFSTYPSIGSMIGSSHLAIGETHTARQIFENILKNINSQRHLDSKIGVIYNELGILARKRGDFGAAIEIYENVVDLFQANLKQDSSVLIDLQNVYNNLAVSYGKIDRYDLAISLLKQQIENPYFSTMDSITTATNLADNYSKAGRHQAAIEAFEQLSEQYARHSRSPLLFLRYGEACSRAQQEEKALEMFQKALLATHTFDASDSYFFSRIYKPMGDSYVSLGKIKQALSSYHKPLSYISSTFSDAPLAQNPAKATMRVEPLTVFLLAQKANAMSVMSGTYSFSEIMDGFLKADSMLVLLRRNQEHDDSKLITSEQTHHLYGNALAVCLRQFQNGDEQGLHLAWYFMERHRANLFWEQLQEQDAFGSLPPDNPLRKEKVRLQEAIRKLKRLSENEQIVLSEQQKLTTRLFSLQEDLEQNEQALAKQFPQYAQLQLREIKPSIETILEDVLDPNQTLIAYFQEDSTVYVITLEKEKTNFIALRIDANLVHDVSGMLSQKSPSDSLLKKGLHALHAMLIKPLGDVSQRLIIIPDGILHTLAFEALIPNLEDINSSWRKTEFLLEKHSVCYAPSGGILAKLKGQKHAGNRPSIAFFPKNFGKSGVSSLYSLKPSAPLREAVNQMDGIVSYEGPQASKAQFLAQAKAAGDMSIVQLFTHAYADPRAPDLSWIQFHGGADSARLYLSDVYNLHVRNDLTILAACETGKGQLRTGEGLMSMARGFFYAGSRSVMATSWKVDLRPTDDILSRFYHQLKQGKPRDIALQAAKIQAIKTQSHWDASPHHWAGMRLFGVSDRIKTEAGLAGWTIVILLLILAAAGYGLYRRVSGMSKNGPLKN